MVKNRTNYHLTPQNTGDVWEQEKKVLLEKTKNMPILAEKRKEARIKFLKEIGLKTEPLIKAQKEAKAREKATIETLKKKYYPSHSEPKRVSPEFYKSTANWIGRLPKGTRLLPPSSVRCLSTKDPSNVSCGGTGTEIPNYETLTLGLFAAGYAEFTTGYEFEFEYFPRSTGQYSCDFHMRFQGRYKVGKGNYFGCFFLGADDECWVELKSITAAWQSRLVNEPQATEGLENYQPVSTNQEQIIIGPGSPVWDESSVSACGEEKEISHNQDLIVTRGYHFERNHWVKLLNNISLTVHSEGEGSVAEMDYLTKPEYFIANRYCEVKEPFAPDRCIVIGGPNIEG